MLKKLVSLFLAISVIFSLLVVFPITSYALSIGTLNDTMPIWAYPASDESFPVYSSVECTLKLGTIYKNDYCKITKAYKNSEDKYVLKVTYPTASGSKTGYVKAVRFIPGAYDDFNAVEKTSNAKTYVSTKVGSETNSGWYISSGDVFYVIERDGNGNSQVVYPVDGGYKMGWIKHYNVKYNVNSENGSGAPATQIKTQNVNLNLSKTTPTREGYTFNGWNTSKDGSGTKYSSGTSYTSNKSVTLYAQWKINSYTIKVTSSNVNKGRVEGGGDYNHGTNVTIKAFPNDGYEFSHWSDGNTSRYRVVEVKSSKEYIANFKPRQFSVLVESNDESMGTVTGGDTYDYNTNITIRAKHRPGHKFVRWSDGDKNAIRRINVRGNARYIAYFTKETYLVSASPYNIKTNENDSEVGYIQNQGPYPYGSYVSLIATPAPKYKFVKWNDGNTSATRTVQVLSPMHYYAYFESTVEPCEHLFGAYMTIEEATCEATGSKYRVCTKCGEREEDIVPIKEHSYGNVISPEVWPTCETEGKGYYVCLSCGQKKSPAVLLPALGHNFVETYIPATCETAGSKTTYCSRYCGFQPIVEEFPAKGHDCDFSSIEDKENYVLYSCKNEGCAYSYEKKLYTFKEDTYNFPNDKVYFSRSAKKLMKASFDKKTFYSVFPEEHIAQSEYIDHNGWSGVCFGMSISSLAFHNNNLNLKDYSDAENVYQIEYPGKYIEINGTVHDEKAGHLRDMIEFFQISQYRLEIEIERKENLSNSINQWRNMQNLVDRVENFIESGNDGIVIRIMRENDDSHAVVPIACRKVENDPLYCFAIDVYDNACPDEIKTIYLKKDSDGNWSGFSYNNGHAEYTKAISFNYLSSVYDIMTNTMLSDTNSYSEILETLSYCKLSTNSRDVVITNKDGMNIENIEGVYEATCDNGDVNGREYFLPYGDYIIENNDESIEYLEVSILGAIDTKTIRTEDNKGKIYVGIHTEKKSTYAKGENSGKDAGLFSTNSSVDRNISILNINKEGVRDYVEADAEYLVLDTSNGTLDIASNVSVVKLNGDNVLMKNVDIAENPSDDEVSVETSSGIIVNTTHIGVIVGATTGSSSSGSVGGDSEKITSCQIGAQNVGFSTDAINNTDYNFTIGVKSNNLEHYDDVIAGSAEFNIYNNSASSNYCCVLFSAYSNDGTLMGEYLHECMLGINNNYIKVDDIYMELSCGNECYVVASVIDMGGVHLSEEVELLLPTETECSLRVVSDNLVLEEGAIRGEMQINAHTKDYISGEYEAYLCFYDENGRFLGSYAQEVSISGTDNHIPFSEINVPCDSEKWFAKCLLWNKENQLKPLATSVVLAIDEVE